MRSSRQSVFATRTHRETGAALVEYALIVAVIAVVALVGVRMVGGSVSDSFDTTAGDIARGGPVEATATANYGDQISATFEVTNNKVFLGDVSSDGWTSRVTKDTGRRINVRFTNQSTGERVVVSGWLNRRDVLKTRAVKR